MPPARPSSSSQPQLRRKPLIASIATVSAGSTRLEVVNTEATCGTTPVQQGTVVGSQVPGDCQQIVCDGNGSLSMQPSPKDFEDDQNPCTQGSVCANGACVNGQPANNGMACLDKDGCTLGTTCINGTCGNPQSQVLQCINGDACCPAGCAGNDNDCLVCHPIVGPPGSGWACPSGATQFCVPPPLNPSSQAQAKAACDACYGISCFEENADCAGPGYGPHPAGQYVGGDAYFGWTSGCSGDDGRVWAISNSFTTYGYWGK